MIRCEFWQCFTSIQKFGVSRFFSLFYWKKCTLHCSKVIVKLFIILEKISVSNKCCYFELLFIKEKHKKLTNPKLFNDSTLLQIKICTSCPVQSVLSMILMLSLYLNLCLCACVCVCVCVCVYVCVCLKDGLVKANMEKLTFYALSAPEKLDRIGAYLSERLSRDVARHRYGYWTS